MVNTRSWLLSLGALGNRQVYLHSSNSVSSCENNLLGSSKVHTYYGCVWKLETTHLCTLLGRSVSPGWKLRHTLLGRQISCSQRESSTCTQEGSIFFFLGRRGFGFWDFWGFWCSHHVSIYCSHKVPSGSQWCSQCVPQVSYVFPNLFPIAPHFIPYFFAQIFTL